MKERSCMLMQSQHKICTDIEIAKLSGGYKHVSLNDLIGKNGR